MVLDGVLYAMTESQKLDNGDHEWEGGTDS